MGPGAPVAGRAANSLGRRAGPGSQLFSGRWPLARAPFRPTRATWAAGRPICSAPAPFGFPFGPIGAPLAHIIAHHSARPQARRAQIMSSPAGQNLEGQRPISGASVRLQAAPARALAHAHLMVPINFAPRRLLKLSSRRPRSRTSSDLHSSGPSDGLAERAVGKAAAGQLIRPARARKQHFTSN